MKLIKKTAAILFAAAMLSAFSVTAFAEEETGDTWETEKVTTTESSDVVSETASEPAQEPAPVIITEPEVKTVPTGDNSSGIAFAAVAAGAAALAAGAAAAGRKKRAE